MSFAEPRPRLLIKQFTGNGNPPVKLLIGAKEAQLFGGGGT